MTVQFADNSEFLEATALLVDLQFAICEDNEERADALRDALDIPLSKLTWEANEWLRGLSSDLDMLCDQEVFEPSELTLAEYQRDLTNALRNFDSNPEPVLALLRKEQNALLSDVVAYYRGRAYLLLGLHSVATLFLRLAIELNSERIEYKVILMGCFWSAGDLDQARLLAETIIKSFAGNFKAFFPAAGILLHILKKLEPDNRAAFGRLRRQIEEAIRALPVPYSHPSLIGLGFTLLGEISEILHRTAQARENYSQACTLMPSDPIPFLRRGRLVFKGNEQKALADFRQAVNLGVSDPFPYLILAREALKTGNYAEAYALCSSVIKIGGPLVQGQAYEFMAIAEAQAHGETDLARHYFNEARRLFPSDGNIQKNQALFEQARNQHTDNSTNSQTHRAKYQFDLQAVNITVQDTSKTDQNDLLDLMLRTRTKQLWLEDNLAQPLSNPRLSIAA